jgi:hypothetical protein
MSKEKEKVNDNIESIKIVANKTNNFEFGELILIKNLCKTDYFKGKMIS